jgi:hypothetical protein
VPQRELLGDGASERDADDDGGVDFGGVKDRGGVLGHVANAVRPRGHVAHPHPPPVVEPDDPVARGQDRHGAVPHVVGVAETLDEKDRRAGAALRPEQSRPVVLCVSHGPIVPDKSIKLPPTSSVQWVVDRETLRRYPKFSQDGDESDGCAVRYEGRPAGARGNSL